MNDGRDLERLLAQNSDMDTNIPSSAVSLVPPRYPYRPDRVFARDDLMKWDMVLNGIDTPYRLAPNAPVRHADRISLKTALKGLKDFKV